MSEGQLMLGGVQGLRRVCGSRGFPGCPGAAGRSTPALVLGGRERPRAATGVRLCLGFPRQFFKIVYRETLCFKNGILFSEGTKH